MSNEKKSNGTVTTITGATLKAAIERIGLSQEGFGRFIGVRGRTVRSWIAEEYPVPRVVALLLTVMLKTKTGPEGLTQGSIADEHQN
jgi:DNA-binding transcriptional regulator YiaG